MKRNKGRAKLSPNENMKKITAAQKFIISTLIIGVVFAVSSFIPAVTNAQYDGGYDYGGYGGGYDYGSYGYDSGSYDYGSYGTGGYDYGSYGYDTSYDYGSYDTGGYDYGSYGYDSGSYDYGGYGTGGYDYGSYGYDTSYDYGSYGYDTGYYDYTIPVYTAPSYDAPNYYTTPYYDAPSYAAPYYAAPSYGAPLYQAPIYNAPSYSAPSYAAPSYQAPSYQAPTYTAPTYTAPTYTAPTYTAPTYTAPTYTAPIYNAPVYNPPVYNPPPVYTYPTPPIQQLPYVTISSNPSIINYGSSSVLNWNSSYANNCYASGGWSGTVSLSGTQTIYPSISTTYTVTCYNNYGQSTAQTFVSVNNQPSYAPAVNITATPNVINNGATALLVWSSSNTSNCYASGAWLGTKSLSGSETVSPSVNSVYSITCSNNVGSASDSDTVIVNSVLGQPPIAKFTAACVASPSVATVNSNVTFVAGKYGGTAPYYYSWSGDIAGSGDVKNFIFDSTGFKSVTLRVTDAYNRVATANCSVQVNPVRVTAAPVTPTTITVATTDYASICEALGYVKPSTLINSTSTGTGTDGNSNIDNTLVTSANGNKSLAASLFFNDQGSPSRFSFILMLYIMAIFFIGFMALIYSAVKRRET